MFSFKSLIFISWMCTYISINWLLLECIFFFTFFFLKIYLLLFNYSCMPFPPSLHPTPGEPTSLTPLHPPPWICSCVLYSSSCNPLYPLYSATCKKMSILYTEFPLTHASYQCNNFVSNITYSLRSQICWTTLLENLEILLIAGKRAFTRMPLTQSMSPFLKLTDSLSPFS